MRQGHGMRRSTTVCNNPYSGAQYVLDTPLLGLLVLVGVQANGDKKSWVSKCILASGIDGTCQRLWQAKKSSTRRASDSTSLREFSLFYAVCEGCTFIYARARVVWPQLVSLRAGFLSKGVISEGRVNLHELNVHTNTF